MMGSTVSEKAPHPNPLPRGEGTEGAHEYQLSGLLNSEREAAADRGWRDY